MAADSTPVFTEFTTASATVATTDTGGGGNRKRRKRGHTIHFSDLNERERIEALSKIRVKPFTRIEALAIEVGDAEEDAAEEDEILSAIVIKVLH